MKRIYLCPPHLSGREMELIRDAVASNWIAPLGPHVDAFEREFIETLAKLRSANAEVRVPECEDPMYAVALSSGTAALHLALRILTGGGKRRTKDDGRGNEVLCPTFTFSASANAIAYEGLVPVFIDCDAGSWNMDPGLLREELAACAKRGKLPRAVIVVDLYGQSADHDPIVAACDEFQVPLIEDAAEALGATYWGSAKDKTKVEVATGTGGQGSGVEGLGTNAMSGSQRSKGKGQESKPLTDGQPLAVSREPSAKMAGSFGQAAAFSFNGNKILTTSGGGMLVSHDKVIIDKARFLATQARDPAPHYQHSEIGFNYRMSNILAAIGRGQLTVLSERVAAHRRNFEFYRQALGDLPGIEFMPEAPFGRCTRWLTCLTIGKAKVKPDSTSTLISTLIRSLEAENIEARPLWKPMHLQPVFKGCRVRGGGVSERLFENGICLPSGSALTEEDLARICTVVRQHISDSRS